MLIICEKSRKADMMQQCYTMLSSVLTTEHLLAWGLSEANPAVVSRQMIDWAMEGDVTVQTVEGQHADNSGDEPGGGSTSHQSANFEAG